MPYGPYKGIDQPWSGLHRPSAAHLIWQLVEEVWVVLSTTKKVLRGRRFPYTCAGLQDIQPSLQLVKLPGRCICPTRTQNKTYTPCCNLKESLSVAATVSRRLHAVSSELFLAPTAAAV
eukprot:1159640-Pelagomonas_calceolata.AAC.9